MDDRKWTEWAGKLVCGRARGRARYLGTVCGACCPTLSSSSPEVRLAASARGLEFLERCLHQILCTILRRAVRCRAELSCAGGSKFLPTPVRSSHRNARELGRGSRELAQHAHASAVCSAVTRSHERMRAGTLASASLGLCAGLGTAHALLAIGAGGGAVGYYLPRRAYRERATLRSETGAGGYEPSGWMGGRLRRCSKGVAIHYGREGGGCERRRR